MPLVSDWWPVSVWTHPPEQETLVYLRLAPMRFIFICKFYMITAGYHQQGALSITVFILFKLDKSEKRRLQQLSALFATNH